MEDKVKVWIARDESGFAFVHFRKPQRHTERGFVEWISHCNDVFDKEFPSVKWEDDEPTEAYITLAEPQEQPKQEQPTPKQEIDWAQRRYEIAKEIMPVIYQRFADRELKYGQIVKKECVVDNAVEVADMLIQKLKEKSE